MSTKSLYIGNLPYRITESELETYFEPYGPVTSVRIIPDKGFGFIDVPEEQMQAAIEATNGVDYNG
ncbi:MAG: RNA-binding protein, partial [Armatimonadota bacterium]